MSGASRAWHRFFLRASLLLQIFVWVSLYTYYYFSGDGTIESAAVSVALAYALTQAVTIVLTPLSAMGLRHGYRNRIVLAVVAVALAYLSLLALPIDQGIAAFVVCMGIYRAFYWAPYRVIARSTPARIPAWPVYLLALLPLIAGAVLGMGGSAGVIVVSVAAIFAALSLIPLTMMRDASEGYAWGYRETFHQLYVGGHRTVTLSGILQGIEMSLLMTVWPIIVFVVLGGSYVVLGVVLSIIYTLSLVVRGMVRRPISALSAPTRALLAGSAWIMRLGVAGMAGIIAVDVYYYGASNAATRGQDMLAHEHAAENSTYVDEYTVLKEISMAIGRLAMALLVALLAATMSATYAFALVFFVAAIASAGEIALTARNARA